MFYKSSNPNENPETCEEKTEAGDLCFQEPPQGSFLPDALPSRVDRNRESHDDQDEEPANDPGCDQRSSANRNGDEGKKKQYEVRKDRGISKSSCTQPHITNLVS